jgi:hypothetical protein
MNKVASGLTLIPVWEAISLIVPASSEPRLISTIASVAASSLAGEVLRASCRASVGPPRTSAC